LEAFYAFSRATFVKNETLLDRYDRVFYDYFRHYQDLLREIDLSALPKDWLHQELQRLFSEEEKAAIERFGDLDDLMQRLQELLEEQDEAHRGGNKWIGTGGTSPFGNQGYHPEGFRIDGSGKHRRAIKVWEQRSFKDLDDQLELNTRNIKMILKRLRFLSREGAPTELDLDSTIDRTSANAGVLDIVLQPQQRNNVKVLLLMDVGGSMDDHVNICAQLFSAARYEFKHLEFFYFHNCVYESLWKDNKRRFRERTPTMDVLHKYNRDYKVIIVGDAAMSPYEIFYRGGSVEHFNDEAGITWLKRLRQHFTDLVWINPLPEYEWAYNESVQQLRDYTGKRMFPMTAEGLLNAMRCLKNRQLTHDTDIWS